MRQLTATITAYKFTELKPDVQQKLTQEQATLNYSDPQLPELMREDFNRDLKELSLPDLTPVFSLNGLQGDGVAFQGAITITQLPRAEDGPTGIRKELRIVQPGERFPALSKIIKSVESEYPGSCKLIVTHADNAGTHAYSFSVKLQMPTSHDDIYDDYQHAFERGISQAEPDEAFERFAREETAYIKFVLEQLRNISHSFEKHGYALQVEHTSSQTAREALLDMEDRLYLADGTPVPRIFLDAGKEA